MRVADLVAFLGLCWFAGQCVATVPPAAGTRHGGGGAHSKEANSHRLALAVQNLQRRQHAARRPLRPANSTSRRVHGGLPRVGEDGGYVLWLRSTHPQRPIESDDGSGEKVEEGSLQQPLDHLDPDNAATWKQVYYRCNDSLVDGGPVFVMLSGTAGYYSDIDWLRKGHMADLARRFKADRFFLPTRFFDDINRPTEDTSTSNLEKYLNTEQILQDVGAFLQNLFDKGDIMDGQKVVLFGAGFGGTIATWARMQFPDMVHAVVASSPTLEPKFDTFSYFPTISHAINWYHKKQKPNCEPALRRAFRALEAALSTRDGREQFNAMFKPCKLLSENETLTVNDRAHILGLVAGLVADLVQEDEDGPDGDTGRPGGDKTAPLCELFAYAADASLYLDILGQLVSGLLDGVCLETSYDKLVQELHDDSWDSDANRLGLRQWLWLQCTELGQLPTTTSTLYSFPFSERIDMKFYTSVCEGAFRQTITSQLVNNIFLLTKAFGGKRPEISQAIFVKGDLDPWRDLAPPDDLQREDVYVFNVLRASHAHDMYPRDDYDPPWMKKTRKAISSILATWLQK